MAVVVGAIKAAGTMAVAVVAAEAEGRDKEVTTEAVVMEEIQMLIIICLGLLRTACHFPNQNLNSTLAGPKVATSRTTLIDRAKEEEASVTSRTILVDRAKEEEASAKEEEEALVTAVVAGDLAKERAEVLEVAEGQGKEEEALVVKAADQVMEEVLGDRVKVVAEDDLVEMAEAVGLQVKEEVEEAAREKMAAMTAVDLGVPDAAMKTTTIVTFLDGESSEEIRTISCPMIVIPRITPYGISSRT